MNPLIAVDYLPLYCQDTCFNFDEEFRTCPPVCEPGCVCNRGFVRNIYGACVAIHDCPSKDCGINEIYSGCGGHCDRTCADEMEINCPPVCISGCVCQWGLVRNHDGECVSREDCYQK